MFTAKRFALVSFGVLCLTLSALIGFHLGSRSAVAESEVDPNRDLVAWHLSGNDALFLDRLGQVWQSTMSTEPACWERRSDHDPPLPVTDIQVWSPSSILALNGDVWVRGEAWHNCGPWPGTPLPTTPSNIGNVKDKYDGDK